MWEIMNHEELIEDEIRDGASQKDIALSYALALCCKSPVDWKRINRAILDKWPKGLAAVKAMAFRIASQRK